MIIKVYNESLRLIDWFCTFSGKLPYGYDSRVNAKSDSTWRDNTVHVEPFLCRPIFCGDASLRTPVVSGTWSPHFFQTENWPWWEVLTKNFIQNSHHSSSVLFPREFWKTNFVFVVRKFIKLEINSRKNAYSCQFCGLRNTHNPKVSECRQHEFELTTQTGNKALSGGISDPSRRNLFLECLEEKQFIPQRVSQRNDFWWHFFSQRDDFRGALFSQPRVLRDGSQPWREKLRNQEIN